MGTKLCITGLLLAAASSFAGGADHLVFSEVAVRGGKYTNPHQSSEFVEIYNPTSASVTSLSNYYITDWTSYFTLPSLAANPALGTGDHLYKFPGGAADVPSGGLVVVTCNAQYFLDAYFNGDLTAFTSQPGSPQLFECFDSRVDVPDMINLNAEATDDGKNLSKTDGGENEFLFYWDGSSDLVKDVDLFMYAGVGVNLGTGNGILDKSGQAVDGPDGDTNASTYATDSGSTENLTFRSLNTATADLPFQFYRRSILEVGETGSGSNGITGHDESMEANTFTWAGAGETTVTASPGVTTLTLSTANQRPVIYNASVISSFPQPGNPLTVTANIADDGTVASANLQIDLGSGFTSVAMTHAGPGNLWVGTATTPAFGTTVKWYVTATDNNGASSSSNDFQYFNRDYPGYESTRITKAIAPGDLYFTELHYDTKGGDNAGESEFAELHNTTNAPIDLSGYRFTKAVDNASNLVVVPEGVIIPAKGYVIFAAYKPLFLMCYPGFDPATVIDNNWPRASVLANSADQVTLVHPNQVGTNGNPSTTIAAFSYTGLVAGSGSGDTGYTYECKSVDGPDNSQANWGVSLIASGTPGRRNSLDNPGNITISNSGRTIKYPTASDAIVINADVTGGIAPLNVQLFYTTSAGVNYTATPMTLSSGNTYSKSLGTLPNETLVKYFVQVTDNNGQVATWPPFATPVMFRVQNTATTDADVEISEIMSDPTDTENVNYSEWIEIYNRKPTPVDLSYFKVGHVLTSTPYVRVLPEGTVVPGYSYLVFAGNKPVFMEQYPTVNQDLVVDGYYIASIIANGSGNAFISHVNEMHWGGLTWQIAGPTFDVVPYYDNSNGWPDTTNNYSRELVNLNSDNSMAANWSKTLVPGGTPGALNSTNSKVTDWSIY